MDQSREKEANSAEDVGSLETGSILNADVTGIGAGLAPIAPSPGIIQELNELFSQDKRSDEDK